MYKSLTKFLFVFFFVLFLAFPLHASANSTDKVYFGITGTESTKPHLEALDVKNVYTWAQGGYAPNENGYLSFLTIRLGYYWWNFSTQNFLALAPAPDTNNCNKNFPYAVNGVTFQYNECTVDTRISDLVGAASNQPIKYIVIGNEPNIYGNNDSDGSLPNSWDPSNTTLLATYHAAQYKIIYDRITHYKNLNPSVTIKVVGPSILGYGSTMNNGTAWFTAFKTAYGSTPPMDYLNFHAYNTHVVSNKRSLNSSEVFDDLTAFRTGMNSNGYTGKEIFITEFGVLNDCSGCSANSVSDIKVYLNSLIDGFRFERAAKLLKGWMLFSWPGVNPVGLFNSNGTLTDYGVFYKNKVAQIFDDVDPIDPAFDQIQAIAIAGITQGSNGSGPLGKDYKPGDMVPRDQMAAFLSRAAGLTPITSGQYFCDVTSSTPFYGEIQAIYVAGISLGSTDACNPQHKKYNPSQIVPRDQMAAFIRRAKGLTPATSGQAFCDVTSSTPFYGDIQALYNAGIVAGSVDSCSPQGRKYFPGNQVPRVEMAIFLYNAFIPH